MTNGKYIFTAMLGVASLNAMAQCPIKDEIMGNHPVKNSMRACRMAYLVHRVPPQKHLPKG